MVLLPLHSISENTLNYYVYLRVVNITEGCILFYLVYECHIYIIIIALHNNVVIYKGLGFLGSAEVLQL